MTETERTQLLAKLESAETLDEIAALEAALGVVDDDQGSDRWTVSTLGEVAEFFGVHPQTLKAWRSEGLPGAEGEWHLGAIARWRISKAERRGADTNETHRALLQEKLSLEVERKKLDFEERQGLLVYRDAVADELREMFNVIRMRLQALPGEISAGVPNEVRGIVAEETTAKITAALKELARGDLAPVGPPDVVFKS